MSNRLYPVSSKSLIVVFGNKQIRGFAEGTGVRIAQKEPSFTSSTGMDGDTMRSNSGSKLFEVRFTLQQTSPSNKHLSTLLRLDEASVNGSGIVDLLIDDPSSAGTTFVATAWITGWADREHAKEGTNREWVLDAVVVLTDEAGHVQAF